MDPEQALEFALERWRRAGHSDATWRDLMEAAARARDYGATVARLGAVLYGAGYEAIFYPHDYAKAKEALLQAVAVYATAPEHGPNFTMSCWYLAIACKHRGEYAEAEAHYARAQACAETQYRSTQDVFSGQIVERIGRELVQLRAERAHRAAQPGQ